MNYLKMLGLLLAAFLVVASSAAANPLTSPEGTAYTSTLKAESSNLKMEGSFVTYECSSSGFEGKVETHSSTSAEGKLSSLSFSGCNYSMTVLKPGTLKIHGGETSPGTVTWSGAEFTLHSSVGQCIFTTNNTDIGTITDSGETKAKAVLDVNAAKIPRTGGNFLCGSSATWTGSFTIATPSTLYVDDGSPPPPASPITSPEGTSYTSTLKAESEGATKLHGSFAGVECAKSALEGKVETHSSTSAEGKLSSFSFSECNYPVEVLKPGTLKIHAGEGNSGTVTSSGAEIRVKSSVGECIFTTSSTDIGTITDSGVTKSNATLDVGSTVLPRTGGNFNCGSSGTWTGSYKVTTPSTLYIHGTRAPEPPSALTSPEGTAYTSTLKAESTNLEMDGSFVSFKCSSSGFEGKIETHSSTSAEGKLSSLSFSGCNYSMTVLKPGTLKIHGGETSPGTVTWSGAEFTLHSSVGQCIFTTNNTDIGTITDSGETKAKAVLDVNAAKIPRTGGNFLCGSSATWTGSFTIATPSTLYVD